MIITIKTANWVESNTKEGKALIAIIKSLKAITNKFEDYTDVIESINIFEEGQEIEEFQGVTYAEI